MSEVLETVQEATTLDVISPSDGSLLRTVRTHNMSEARYMLERARSLFDDRQNWLSIEARVAILKKVATLLAAEAEGFARLIAQEGGKPISDARIEVERAINGIEYAADEVFNVMRGAEVSMQRSPSAHGKRAFTSYEPIGVVVAVSAFNHPLNLIVHQVVPALAIGCPVIVKPAGATPLCCLDFVDLLHQAGLPDGWVQACVSDNEVAEMLVTSTQINFFSFIGSANVGWHLKSKLAPGVRCALEHGGVAPTIVDKSADLEATVASLLRGAF